MNLAHDRYPWLAVLPYATAFFVSVFCTLCFLLGQNWAMLMAQPFWLVVALIDAIPIPVPKTPLMDSQRRASQKWWTILVCATAAAQLPLLASGFYYATRGDLDLVHATVVAAFTGVVGGTLSIPAAHELMHVRSPWARALASTQMALFGYSHFCIAHVFDHHRHVGLHRDPATARRGESFYAFFQRSRWQGVANAWAIERRLARERSTPFLLSSSIVRSHLFMALVYGLAYSVSGLPGIVFVFVQGAAASTLLELINYVQHYGLTRRFLGSAYEPIGLAHAWSSKHAISNWLLLNLPRHASHHLCSTRSFQLLEHSTNGPSLPLGYFSLLLVALIPSLWYRVMDTRLDDLKRRLGTDEQNNLRFA